MEEITAREFLRTVPSMRQMHRALSKLDAELPKHFMAGHYHSIFPDVGQGYAPLGFEEYWAKTYAKNPSLFEKSAVAVRNTVTIDDRWKSSLVVLSFAAKAARKSIAGVSIGITPVFEGYVANEMLGTLPRRVDLAKTAGQVQCIRDANEAGYALNKTFLMLESDDLDDYLLNVLVQTVYPKANGETWGLFRLPAQQYQGAVFAWLGRSRKSALEAIRLASAGATAKQIRKFGAAEIPLEYALQLISSGARHA